MMKLEQELTNMIFSLYYLTVNKYVVNDWMKNKFIVYFYQEESEELKKARKIVPSFYLFIWQSCKYNRVV